MQLEFGCIFALPRTHFVDEVQPVSTYIDFGMVLVNCLRQKQLGIAESICSALDTHKGGLKAAGWN